VRLRWCRHPAGSAHQGGPRAAFFVGQPQRSASRVAADGALLVREKPANVARLLTCGKFDGARGLPDGVVEGSLGSGSGWHRLRLVLGTGRLRDLGGRREHGASALYESSALVRPYVPLLLGGSGMQGIV